MAANEPLIRREAEKTGGTSSTLSHKDDACQEKLVETLALTPALSPRREFAGRLRALNPLNRTFERPADEERR